MQSGHGFLLFDVKYRRADRDWKYAVSDRKTMSISLSQDALRRVPQRWVHFSNVRTRLLKRWSECVNEHETPELKIYGSDATRLSSGPATGGFIQTALGREAGSGFLPVNRSGCASNAACKVCARAAITCGARPSCTISGVSMPIPA